MHPCLLNTSISFFQLHLGIKSAAGFIAAPAIGPKAKPSQITHVKFYKKILPKALQTQALTALIGFAYSAHFAHFANEDA